MIPSLLEAALGLWLVWVAVLDPALGDTQPWIIAASAALLIVIGLAALRADYLKWPAVADIAIGVVLLLLFFAMRIAGTGEFEFWILFWSGCIAGVVSLWSAFYRHGPAAPEASSPGS